MLLMNMPSPDTCEAATEALRTYVLRSLFLLLLSVWETQLSLSPSSRHNAPPLATRIIPWLEASSPSFCSPAAAAAAVSHRHGCSQQRTGGMWRKAEKYFADEPPKREKSNMLSHITGEFHTPPTHPNTRRHNTTCGLARGGGEPFLRHRTVS